ncbi:hypothetical protein WOB94_23020 [Vibrio parahaemolyticus]|uniref:hypothetical protein n=1 Tax=Vibrio parahaemolyticus TaxID=670 RepID=UPI0016551298|nr:hypothetical protein [Vibrio parahaemolyticus]MBC8659601.1 hypothetical protein [Vibrio parahaemolyticus]MBE4171341.1 hypothetical protein [Vibrio parahaemolyticus]MBM5014404.1 hypothetical protein [Vibrio parahaemolyticus]MCR9712626.1 hypothetical protein [Vibrio parahaemolyticus]MCR9757993.1 hypothetical protein [Vibrio parahaemolyticus]
MSKDTKPFDLWNWVKAICTVIITLVFGIKVYQTPIALTVDFPTLLSLLLGFFSVALAALFYFKATETSNQFYDNTYKFTKQIAELLVKMESGFGEKLNKLDEGYASMRDYIQSPNNNYSSTSIETTKTQIEEEQKEIQKVIEERNQIVRDLLSKSQLQEEEKLKISTSLEDKEKELNQAHEDIAKMKKRLFAERMKVRNLREHKLGELNTGAIEFTEQHVLRELGGEDILNLTNGGIFRRFNAVSDDLPRAYIRDLESVGHFDGGLTSSGIKLIRDLAEKRFA